MDLKKPLAIVLGLTLVLSATSILGPYAVKEASAALDLAASRGTPTVTILDPLPESAVAKGSRDGGNSVVSNVMLHTGEKVTFNGKLITQDGDVLSNMAVNIYALTPTPEQKLLGSAVTGIDGSFSVTWVAQPYYVKAASTETLKSSGSQTMNIFAQFEGKDNLNPSKSGNIAVAVKSWDLIIRMASDKSMYKQGDKATVFINFIQGDILNGNINYGGFVSPDVIKASFDGQAVEPQKKKEGSYTFIVDSITKEHHQLVVSSEKQGYNAGSAYLTLVVEGLR